MYNENLERIFASMRVLSNQYSKLISQMPPIQYTQLMNSLNQISTIQYSQLLNSLNQTSKQYNQLMNSVNQMPVIQMSQKLSYEMNKSAVLIGNILSKIKVPAIDFDKFRISLYKRMFKEHSESVERLYDSTIFPPIFYLVEKDIFEFDKEVDLENWIQTQEIKDYYLASIKDWKKKYSDENMDKYIDEIYFNYDSNNYATVSHLIYTLLEYLYEKALDDIEMPQKYKKIKDELKEKVFIKVDLPKLYDKFIKNNLYANTKTNPEFSRHAVHGEIYLLMSPKNAMNAIFIYDFIEKVLKIKNTST